MGNIAKLTSLIFCENVQNIPAPQGMTSNIISAFNSIKVPVIPTLYTFFVVASLDCKELNIGDTIKISIFDPNEELLCSTGDVTLPVPEIKPNDYPNTINFNMDMRNLFFKEEGNYNVIIYANGIEIGSRMFNVSKTTMR